MINLCVLQTYHHSHVTVHSVGKIADGTLMKTLALSLKLEASIILKLTLGVEFSMIKSLDPISSEQI